MKTPKVILVLLFGLWLSGCTGTRPDPTAGGIDPWGSQLPPGELPPGDSTGNTIPPDLPSVSAGQSTDDAGQIKTLMNTTPGS